MMTRTISAIGATGVTLATGGLTPNILLIEGFCNGVANTQYFIQIHNVIPSSGITVPLRSLQVLGVDGFTFNKYDIGLQTANLTSPPAQTSFYIFLSTTDAVFTNPGITADINVDIEEYELELSGTNIIGPTAGAITVFTDPNPQLRLVQITAVNNVGTKASGALVIGNTYSIATYFAGDDFTNVGAASNALNVTFIATGTTPAVWTFGSTLAPAAYVLVYGFSPITTNTLAYPGLSFTILNSVIQANTVLKFGYGMYISQIQPNDVNGYVLHTGCYLVISTNPIKYNSLIGVTLTGVYR